MEVVFEDLVTFNLGEYKVRFCELDGSFFIEIRKIWRSTRFGLFLTELQARDVYDGFEKNPAEVNIENIRITKTATRFICEKTGKPGFHLPSSVMHIYMKLLPCFFHLCSISLAPEFRQFGFVEKLFAAIITLNYQTEVEQEIAKNKQTSDMDGFLSKIKTDANIEKELKNECAIFRISESIITSFIRGKSGWIDLKLISNLKKKSIVY